MGPAARHGLDPVPVLSTTLRRGGVLRDVFTNARRGPAQLAGDPPLVTVIIATFNYSVVLRHAIRSVLRQRYENIELLVVGDACTDDSEEVALAFGDPRLRWINRAENAGIQSGPNNTGLENAKGKYVAYLGHDDLWHPWHLAFVVGALERAGRPWGHGLCEVMAPPGQRLKLLAGLSPGDRPLGRWLAPTSIVHDAELGRRMRWRHYLETPEPVDIEFEDRLQKASEPPLRVHALTSFKFTATWRENCYREKPDNEQAEWSRRLEDDPRLLERELASLLFHRLSPWHSRLQPVEEPPADAEPGWIAMRSRRLRGLE